MTDRAVMVPLASTVIPPPTSVFTSIRSIVPESFTEMAAGATAESLPTAEFTEITLVALPAPVWGRPAVRSAELPVIRDVGEDVALVMLPPAVMATFPPVCRNVRGVVSTLTAPVCMNVRAAVVDPTSGGFVRRIEVPSMTRSIFVSDWIPGPVTSMPAVRLRVEDRPDTRWLPVVVCARRTMESLNVQLVFSLVAPCST